MTHSSRPDPSRPDPSRPDKAQLAAFADGELSPEEAAAVVIHLADHPEDQAYVDEVMAANLALARAFAAPAQEPLPDRFGALLRAQEARILPFAKPRRRFAGVFAAGLALAAALAAVAVLPGPDAGLTVGPVAGGSQLHDLLQRTPSGETVPYGPQGALTILSSLPALTGYCREFELVSAKAGQMQLGLACQDGAGWVLDVVFAEALPPADPAGDGFAPASGDDAGAMDRWLDRRGAGTVLTLAQEAALIAQGWAP